MNWIGWEKSQESGINARERDTMRCSRRESKVTELSEQAVVYPLVTQSSSRGRGGLQASGKFLEIYFNP
jgi:hypothetical protein